MLTERQPPDWEVVVSGVEGREEEAGLPLVPEGKQNTAQNQMLVKSTTLNVTLGIVFGVRGAIFGGDPLALCLSALSQRLSLVAESEPPGTTGFV